MTNLLFLSISLLYIGFASRVIFTLVRRGVIISLVGGLHLNTLLSMGVGPLAYVLFPAAFDGERINHGLIIENALVPYGLSLIGYLVAFVALVYSNRGARFSSLNTRLLEVSSFQMYMFFALGLIGIAAINARVNESGLGTVFNVLYLFVFPLVSLAVFRAGDKSIAALVGAAIIVGGIGYYSLTSYWRSLSLLFAISLVIGLFMRHKFRPMLTLSLAVLSVAWYVWMFPFLQLKKSNAPSGLVEIFATFRESQELSMADRLPVAFSFLGLRTNGAREIGYIETGLRNGVIDLRYGESYKETILQLVPRVLWPSKPSFNLAMNYELPRAIGLLGSDDYETSSGVGLWAEATWNLGPYFLMFYVPALFWTFGAIDRRVLSSRLDAFSKWLLASCLFYLSLQVLNLVNFVTMVLWTIIVVSIYNKFLYAFLSGGRPVNLRLSKRARLG